MLDRTAYRNAVVKLLPYDTIGEEPEADLVGKPKLSEDDAMIVYGCATFFDEDIPLSSFDSQPTSVKLLEVVVHSALSVMLSVTTQKAARRYIFQASGLPHFSSSLKGWIVVRIIAMNAPH